MEPRGIFFCFGTFVLLPPPCGFYPKITGPVSVVSNAPLPWGTILDGRNDMGAIWRFIVWAWRRWADYNSLVALLDILDWKTGLWAFLGGVGMTFYAATNMGWSPQAVV